MACTREEAMAAFGAAFERAIATGRRNMNAMSLATVSDAGLPSVRFVLLKSIDARGLVFFTDARSRKATELDANPVASACLYWEPIEEQARIDGRVERVSVEEVVADFEARPRAARILLWASAQSQPLDTLQSLREAVACEDARLPEPVPVSPHWTGYRLIPTSIEIWRGSRDRLHERTVYAAEQGGWRKQLLQP